MENNRREQNYWPGFVDALSNLVLTLVFVMTIFILALFFLSSKVTQGKLSRLCPETQAELEQAKKDLDESHNALLVAQTEAKQAQEQIQALKKEMTQTSGSLLGQSIDINVKQGKSLQDKKALMETSDKDKTLQGNRTSTEALGNGSAITIRFPSGTAELDAGTKESLDKVLAPFLAEKQQIKIILNAVPGPETYSEGKRLSFFRAVAIRNYMIGTGIPGANIESKVAEHGNSDPKDPDGRVVIQLQRTAK